MLPSQTVENYLKTIYLAQSAPSAAELVPMGQLASALGVVPGTATTMVKALAESGLGRYEPYPGVRLTPGHAVVIDSRDRAADAVHLRDDAGKTVTLGTRAASKILARLR